MSAALRAVDVTNLVSSYESEFSKIADENEYLRMENARLSSALTDGKMQAAFNDAYSLLEALAVWIDEPERVAAHKGRAQKFLARTRNFSTRKRDR